MPSQFSSEYNILDKLENGMSKTKITIYGGFIIFISKVWAVPRIAFFNTQISLLKNSWRRLFNKSHVFLFAHIWFGVNFRGRQDGIYKEPFFVWRPQLTLNHRHRGRVLSFMFGLVCVGCDKKVASIFYIYKYDDGRKVLILKWFLNCLRSLD